MPHNIVCEFMAIVDETFKQDGDIVEAGDKILTISCMKMLFQLDTPVSGVVYYNYRAGEDVQEGDILARIE